MSHENGPQMRRGLGFHGGFSPESIIPISAILDGGCFGDVRPDHGGDPRTLQFATENFTF
jgi:hypothetical protein